MPRHVLFLLLALTPAARADDAWPVPRGPSREPAPYTFDRASLTKLPADFLDDSAAVILYAATTHLVEADGTVEAITHEVTRLNGRKGVEKLGEVRNIVYTPSYQKLTLNEARVHKPDGKIVRVLPRHVHLRDVGTDFQSYDPEKQLIITFPSLEVGDTIEVKWTVRGKNPEHAGQFFNRYALGDLSYPIALDEYRVRLAKGLTLKHAVVNAALAPAITDDNGEKLYVWKQANLPRGPRDEAAPSKEELRPTVVVSTFASWDEVGKWKHKLREACWECTDAVRKAAHRATRDCKTPLDKARALTYFVRRNVRYLSTGERHDYTPHKPAEVLANRYGDCKDTSQLLAVMLREVGLKVELATLGTLDDGQVHPDVPSPWGTHAILCVTIDGKPHWIDTTARLAGWDQLPRDDLDRLCYLTDDKGKLRLLRTPAATAAGNRTDLVTEVRVGPDGTSQNKRTAISYGLAALSARDKFVEVPAGEQRRQLASELQDANSRSRLVGFRVEPVALADHDGPVKVTMHYEVPGHFDGSPEMDGSVTDSRVWGRFLGYNLDHDRKVPLVLPGPFEARHTYRFELPATFTCETLPRSREVGSKWGTFSAKVKALDPPSEGTRRLEVAFHFRLDKPRVEVADFAEFRKFHEQVMRQYRVWVSLRPARGLSAAPLLEEWLEASPQRSDIAVTLARLYVRNDQRAEARRVLERACYYSPDVAELWDLRVEAAETGADIEAAERLRYARFPKVAQNGIDLASVLVSRGKQDEARKVLGPLTKVGGETSRARAHYQLARSYYRDEQPKLALEQLDQAVKQDPDVVATPAALILRARVLDELGRAADAVAAYKKAWEQDRTNQEAMLSLVRLSLVTKDRAAALDYLRRYTLAVSQDAGGLALAAETYFKLGRLDDALELAQRSREVRFHEKAQRVLGLVYLVRGDDARAITHLEKAEPDAVVLAAWVEAALNLGRVGELESLLRQAARVERPTDELARICDRARRVAARRAELARQAPKAAAAALDAAACAEAGGQRVERLLSAALASPAAIGPAYALRGRLALGRGELRAAAADAEKAIALSPADAGGYYVRGRVRLEREAAGAVDDLEKAVRLSRRHDAVMLLGLAEALEQAGRVGEALRVAREGLLVEAGHAGLKAAEARLVAKVRKAG